MHQVAQDERIKDIFKGVALTSLVFLFAVQLPIIGSLIALTFLPVPIILYRIKLGRYIGTIIPAAVLLIVWFTISSATFNMLFFTQLILIGLVLSECIGLNLRVEKAVLYPAGAVLGTGFLMLVFYSIHTDTGITALVSENFTRNRQMLIQANEAMGQSKEMVRELSDFLALTQRLMFPILPAIAVSMTLFAVWTNLLISRPVLKRRHLFFPDYGPLNHWKTPDILVWGVIACIILLFMPVASLNVAGLNGLIILMTIYFFQGIAIVSFYFEKKGFSRFLRIILYTIIAMQHIMLFSVVILGLFDAWMDFRKLNTTETDI